jgi:hypothetical protein
VAASECRLVAGDPVEKLKVAGPGVVDAVRLHGGEVGPVRPGQAPVRASKPDRLTDPVEKSAQGLQVASHLGELSLGPQPLEPIVCDLPQTQESLAANGATVRFDEPSALRVQREPERLPPRPQGLNGALQGRGVVRRQPGAEGERLAQGCALADDGRVSFEARPGRPVRPGDQDLAIGAQEERGPILRAAKACHLTRERPLALGPASALAQVQESRGDGEDQQSHDQPEPSRGLRLDPVGGARKEARSLAERAGPGLPGEQGEGGRGQAEGGRPSPDRSPGAPPRRVPCHDSLPRTSRPRFERKLDADLPRPPMESRPRSRMTRERATCPRDAGPLPRFDADLRPFPNEPGRGLTPA